MPEIFQFPDVEQALEEPNGLLAMGGQLDSATLIDAYSRGIFPWYNEDQPLLWWSPDPRAVIRPEHFRPSRSLRRTLKKCGWSVTVNANFPAVIRACAETRNSSASEADGTWIHPEMIQAYEALHRDGFAHSIEVWEAGESNGATLVGGIYGVGINRVFSGESMFHRRSDASKVAVAVTCQHLLDIGWSLLDCQVPNSHLSSLGAELMPRQAFVELLASAVSSTGSAAQWQQLRRTLAADYAQVFQ